MELQAAPQWQRPKSLLRQGLSQKGYGSPPTPAPPDDGELLIWMLLLVLELLLDVLESLELLVVSESSLESLELELSLELL